ncbi:MAG: hypothetical protein V2B18_08520 [Pseudomonadota bacterium]
MDEAQVKLGDLLHASREAVVKEWLRRLRTEVSPRYAARPERELVRAVSDAFDANLAALTNDDYSKLNEAIEY